jgi:hypothetical protein
MDFGGGDKVRFFATTSALLLLFFTFVAVVVVVVAVLLFDNGGGGGGGGGGVLLADFGSPFPLVFLGLLLRPRLSFVVMDLLRSDLPWSVRDPNVAARMGSLNEFMRNMLARSASLRI